MSWDYHRCKCGQPHIVYVPKKLILEEKKGFGPEAIRAAEEIDERNQGNLLEFIDEEEIIKVYQERLDYLWEFNQP